MAAFVASTVRRRGRTAEANGVAEADFVVESDGEADEVHGDVPRRAVDGGEDLQHTAASSEDDTDDDEGEGVTDLGAALDVWGWGSALVTTVWGSIGYAYTACFGGGSSGELVLDPETQLRMDAFRAFTRVPYDADDAGHEAMLALLWQRARPGHRLTARKSDQWKEIGFQGNDPATDFRGGGIFSLANLVYVADVYPDLLARLCEPILDENDLETLPFAIAGLNVAMAVGEILGWGFRPTEVSPAARRKLVDILFVGDDTWPADLVIDAAEPASADGPERESFNVEYHRVPLRASQREYVFEEVFTALLILTHRRWVEVGATYMFFNDVLRGASADLQALLADRWESVDDVIAWNATNA